MSQTLPWSEFKILDIMGMPRVLNSDTPSDVAKGYDGHVILNQNLFFEKALVKMAFYLKFGQHVLNIFGKLAKGL